MDILTLDWKALATIGIPAIIVVAGWFFVHRLNARRDLTIRKREARLRALEAAFMRLATSSNRPLTDQHKDEIERFVAEIQLYGTPRHINLMTVLVEGFKKPNNKVSYDDLLVELRDSIRKELDLEQIDGPVWWLRLGRGPNENTTKVSSSPP
jgi:hypothetical protein